MTQRLELSSVTIPIKLFIALSGSGVTGLVASDLTVLYHDGAGLSGTLSMDDAELQEIDAVNFPGEYLLKDYPEDLTAEAGIAKISWSGGSFDTGSIEVDVSEEKKHLRFLYARSRNDLVWNPGDDSNLARWELYDDTSPVPVLLGYWLAEDAQGSEAIISGTGPATRRAFVEA